MNELHITLLFVTNSVIASAAYLPQIVGLWRSLRSRMVSNQISVLTWLMWLWTGTTTLLYSLFLYPHDAILLTVNAVNLFFCAVTVWLVILVRLEYRRQARNYYHGSGYHD